MAERLGDANVPVKQAQVPEEIDRLNGVISKQEECIARLVERLGPVLSIADFNEDDNTKVAEELAPLAQEINECAHQVARNNTRLQHLMRRLEV